MPSTVPARRLSLSLVGLAAAMACGDPSSTSPQLVEGTAHAELSTATAPRRFPRGTAPTIVLVHGAFADATGWQKLIPLLQEDDYDVIAVQNPLTSLADDVASTRRVIDAQPGDVVVVGHSYGGAVISGAAEGSSKVRALVYIAAFAPDVGESVLSLSGMFPPTPLGASIIPDAAGFAYIDASKYHDVFAADLPRRITRVMAVTQKPASYTTLGDASTGAAWRSIPSWYVVARQDRTINPDLERFVAKRMGARTTEITSSHVPFISHPAAMAAIIREAAETTAR